jgi:flavin reductase (DIM6/NTAB) family NADH-FMN oxidoreductase RutF
MDEKAKKTALQHITYGLYVIGSKGKNDANGMTANCLTQISFEPPMIALAVEETAHTRKLIDESKVFSVNVLPSGTTEDLLTTFTKPQKRVGNKFEKYEVTDGKATGAPILKDALSFFECKVIGQHKTGDHILYIAEVVEAGVIKEGNPLTLNEVGWQYGG